MRSAVILSLLFGSLLAAADGTNFGVSGASTDVSVEVSCSAILDRPSGVKRISVANGEIAEAVATSTTEIVINGKAPGDTTLIVWDQSGNRSVLSVHVLPPSSKIDLVRDQIMREAGQGVTLTAQDGLFFLNGTARDLSTADRALDIASALGKVVNLLRVTTPSAQPQILLKVRFADIDRSVSSQFAFNLFGGSATKGIGGTSTGQYGGNPAVSGIGTSLPAYTFSNLLNVFYFRPDINIGAILQDLASRNLLQLLAEPNLLTVSGKSASFLAGGEFPFPTLQGGGSGVGQVTIQFREFGIKLAFTPTITPRGTIRLEVKPEVSSLDYANGLTVSGFTVPGLDTRRVDTEVELKAGQSFVIAGLLNNQITEQLSRMPGLASIPLLGKLFQSRNIAKSNSELLILVTPELVTPINAGEKLPNVDMPEKFLTGTASNAPQATRDADEKKAAESWRRDSIPVEDMKAAKSISAPVTPAGPSVAGAEAAVAGSANQNSTPQTSTPQVSTPQVSTPQVSTPQVSTPAGGDPSHPKN
jgi:pilus assembly protein CpaC